DDCTVGGILSGVEVLLHLFTRCYFLLTIGHLEWTEEGEILARSRWHLVAERGQETGSRARLKEMNTGLADLIAHLAQGRNVIEDPERAAMSSDHQVVVLDHDIVDGYNGQIQAQALPMCSVVERHVETCLSSGIEQAAPHRVLADHTRKVVVRYSSRDLRPGLPKIIGLVKIGSEIVLFVTGGG